MITFIKVPNFIFKMIITDLRSQLKKQLESHIPLAPKGPQELTGNFFRRPQSGWCPYFMAPIVPSSVFKVPALASSILLVI